MHMDLISQDLQKRLNNATIFMKPDRLVEPIHWIGHIPFTFWIVNALKPAVLVELGTQSGNSYCAFLQIVHELKLATKCYAVDTWHGDLHTGNYGEEVFKDLEAHHNEKYASFSRLVRSTFDEAVRHFSDNSIDLLHIDGHHTYDSVSHDFNNWLPKVSKSGVILFHDINVRQNDFGVWKLWEELTNAYPSFSFLHSNGLGVLAVGPDMLEPIRWLTTLNKTAPHCVPLVQSFFAKVSCPLYDIIEKSRALEQIKEMTRQIERISKQNEELSNRNEELLKFKREITASFWSKIASFLKFNQGYT